MGGVAGTLIYLWCRGGCSNQRVAAAITYYPPEPFYDITYDESSKTYSLALNPVVIDPGRRMSHDIVEFVRTKNGFNIAVVLFIRPGAQYTLIYSHGNATDIGGMYERAAELVDAIGVNLVLYDYAGYGCSTGHPTEYNTYADIAAVYAWTCEKVEGAKVLLYGQSVGSGPSCWLASREKSLAGLILHSPIASGLRVITQNRCLGCCDVYPNVDRITKVSCPVMIIHGKEDEEVALQHGMQLYERIPSEYRREPWWIEGKGHNDIVDEFTITEYYQRLDSFIRSLSISA